MQDTSALQTFVDSLCQCFGTSPGPPHQRSQHAASTGVNTYRSQEAPHTPGLTSSAPSTPSTPEMKRRTRSLALKDKQWDALFAAPTDKQRSTSLQPRPSKNPTVEEHAQAVAEAKRSAATRKPRRGYPCKRKRSRSKEEIFRSKKEAVNHNAFSRFLSNNPALMKSLCFATPIHDSRDLDAASVVSDSGTLNTAEDTITSTLYYETTRLAGLKQTNPPMPLFDSHAVEEQDDIHQIVNSHSHSSVKLLNVYKHHAKHGPLTNVVELEDTPPTTPGRRNTSSDMPMQDDAPPAVTSSSDSSSPARRQ
jgi:hypothetical protein